jgi:hypothetical protein
LADIGVENAMNHIGVLAAVMCMIPSAVLAAPDDPLAPARAGELQCYTPDTVRKTCSALAGYTFGSDGIDNQAEVLLSPKPLIVMKSVSPVWVRAGAVCGPLRKQDIDAATIFVFGQVASDAQAAQIRAQIEAGYGSRLGKEVCTTYTLAGDRYIAQVTIDGSQHPELSDKVIWVRQDEGYTVAP